MGVLFVIFQLASYSYIYVICVCSLIQKNGCSQVAIAVASFCNHKSLASLIAKYS